MIGQQGFVQANIPRVDNSSVVTPGHVKLLQAAATRHKNARLKPTSYSDK